MSLWDVFDSIRGMRQSSPLDFVSERVLAFVDGTVLKIAMGRIKTRSMNRNCVCQPWS